LADRDSRSIFVSNLPFSATREQILAVFTKFGEVKHLDSKSLHKGYCFVEYGSPDHAAAAAKSPPLAMDSRTLVIEERRTKGSSANGVAHKPNKPKDAKVLVNEDSSYKDRELKDRKHASEWKQQIRRDRLSQSKSSLPQNTPANGDRN